MREKNSIDLIKMLSIWRFSINTEFDDKDYINPLFQMI